MHRPSQTFPVSISGYQRLFHRACPPASHRFIATLTPLNKASTFPLPLSSHRIVTSFLTLGDLPTPSRPSPSFRVALLHRSPTRPYYPSLWAACTGSVEPSDVSSTSAALREIEEETGLYERELELLKGPKAWELLDEKVGKRWMAEVFAWRVTGGFPGNWAKDAEEWERQIRGLVKLNVVENTELRWVRLEEVEEYQTVEGLGSSLRRVLGVGEWAEL